MTALTTISDAIAATYHLSHPATSGPLPEELYGLYENRLYEVMKGEWLFTENEITLKDLAGKVGLRHHQLSQVLNQHMGISFHDFLNRYRIERARKLLAEDDNETIIGIAYECGFNSKVTFNQAFKKHTGITPKEYRQRIQAIATE
jgi:AraC-like DNA-binding protein